MLSRSALPWVLVLAIPCLASADETNGRATGSVEARTSTYHERLTDVVAPSVAGRIDLPSGARVRGHYLLDAITSASVTVDVVSSATVGVDPLAHSAFHERRQEGALGAGSSWSGERSATELDASLRYSHEPDYQSYSGALVGSVDLRERTRTITFGVSFTHDEVRQVARMPDPSTGETIRQIVRSSQGDHFDAVVGSLGTSLVLSRVAILDAAYEFSFQTGYLGSPYRRVRIDEIVAQEVVPSRRARHTGSLSLHLARPRVRGALHLTARGYLDDWSIRAITTEARWYQAVGPHLLFRGRFRFYSQTAAFFDSGQGVIAPSYTSPVDYTTSNPRYAAMRSYEVGAAFVTRLGFFPRFRGEVEQPEVEFAVDHRIASNRFGNATSGTFSVRIPFR